VGALAATAAACSGLDVADQRRLRLAGHVHDLGNVSLPQRVWTKDERLNRPELEAVHLHTYHAERILSSARALQPMGALAGMHHERLDGSGYHRGVAEQPKHRRRDCLLSRRSTSRFSRSEAGARHMRQAPSQKFWPIMYRTALSVT
jgi:HD domain